MTQETALKIIHELYGKENAESILRHYIPYINKQYKPRSWLQAVCHLAVGGRPLFNFK